MGSVGRRDGVDEVQSIQRKSWSRSVWSIIIKMDERGLKMGPLVGCGCGDEVVGEIGSG